MRTSHSLGKFLPHAATFAVALTLVLPLAPAGAAELKQARISQVVKDVKLLPGQAAPRPANVSDEVRDNTAVRTGTESRAELTFTDATLARLGANTIFSFNGGTRNLDLGGGAMLLRVPKNAGGAKINTAAITAAITGTTIMLEYHPDAYIKFIVLEGTGRIYRNNRIGESVLLHAGQMLIVNPNGEGLPEPVDVDIERILRTSLLINGFPPLPSNDLIAREINGQLLKKSEGELIETNLVIFGRGTAVTLLDPNYSAIIDQARATESNSPTPTMSPTPTPAGTPAKFGALSVITSPDPYVITGNTVIHTDPSITTNGQTDVGKIYRGPTADGTPSNYFFGSTSAFDNDSGFNGHFSQAGNLPVAAFKFSSLVLSGNPIISLVNGGATSLALISVGNIASGTGLATVTFAGLDSLLVATQNGSITLGSNLTFQNIPTLFLYARGAGSVLTFDAAVNGTNNLVLFSEADIAVTNSFNLVQTSSANFNEGLFATFIAGRALSVGGDFNLLIDTGISGNDSGINVVTSNGTMNFGGSLDLRMAGAAGKIANGASINVSSGSSLNVGDSLHLPLGLASTQLFIQHGANVVLSAVGQVTVTNDAILNILANEGGHIGNGGSIFFSAAGFQAGSLSALINLRNGGTIDEGGNLIFTLAGALDIRGDASLVISGRNDGAGGGVIGAGGAVSLSADSIDVGGNLVLAISGGAGGSFASANNTVFATNDLSTGGGLDFSVQNGGNTPGGFIGGGTIEGDALLSLTAANVSIGSFLNALVANVDGGVIGGNVSVGLGIDGDITVQTNALFQIVNATFFDNPGSTIGGNADMFVGSTNLSTGGFLLASISNEGGGTIGAGASIVFVQGGAITSVGDATFRILNDDNGAGNGGGSIGQDAVIFGNAQSLSAANLIARIDNSGGTIGGNSTITFALNGALNSDSALFSVLNDGGTIGGDIVIDVSVASVTTNGLFTSSISNLGGSALATNSISVAIAGALTAGDASFSIFDAPNAGPPGVDSISVTAGSISLTGSLGASVNVSADTPVFLTDNVSISAAQNVTVGGGISVFGSLNAGGNITAGGTILIGGGNLTATGNITSTNGDIVLQSSADGIGTITAGGSINTHNLTAPSAQAGANITIGGTLGGPFSVVANTLAAGGAINLINVNSVTGFSSTFGPNGGFTPDPFTLSANSLNVVGPSIPALTFNGSDGGSSDPGNGGSVTLNLTADGLTIGNTGDFTSIMVNGGAFAVNGSSGGGNGGTVNITTSGDVTVNDAGITADSGANPTGTPAGNGGTVNITSGGTVNVNAVGQTSGNGSGGSNSVTGGNINLTSSRATGVAINVNNTGQLLALLEQVTPGPGGKITILATGASSSVAVNGGVEADKGTVDIRHTGANGVVNLGDATGTSSVTLNGDIVKAGALGANGVLNIGGGSLSADSVLKLYAPSSNGTLNFVANVTLSSGTDAILAANTITIQPTVVVNVQGNGGPAQVFTNNPNYSGSGGNNSGNGTFGGNGANNPLPLNQAPAFDGPPGG
ncbi:MAG: FecR domain-containing protein [Chthoniobacterales bacterium]